MKILNLAQLVGVVLIFFGTSCSYTSKLKKDQKLLRSNKIIIDSEKPLKNKGDLMASLETIPPKPNTHLLDVGVLPRWKLWKYLSRYKYYQQNPGDPKIRTRKVEAPVLVDSLFTRRADTLMKNYMLNRGYYHSSVSDSIVDMGNGEAKVIYTVRPGKQFYIKKVEYKVDDPGLLELVDEKNAYLKAGQPFSTINSGLERDRLFKKFRSNGYYGMKSENISLWVDTLNRDRFNELLTDEFSIFNQDTSHSEYDSIEVYIHVEKTRNEKFDKTYTVQNIFVQFKEVYQSNPENLQLTEDEYKDLIFRYSTIPVNKEVIYNNIQIRKGDVYSTAKEASSYKRLSRLGVFQFVNIRFEPSYLDSTGLDCFIDLTPASKMDIQTMLDLSTSEEYFVGFGAGLNYLTRNLWRGANRFSIKTQYALEVRSSGNQEQPFGQRLYLNANNFSIGANLAMPKFIVPFRFKDTRGNLPYTILGFSLNRVNRIDQYLLYNGTANWSYNWQDGASKSWLATPMFLSYTFLPPDRLTDTFKHQINQSNYLKHTYSDNLIQGEGINYEEKIGSESSANFHALKIGLEEAGLLMQGINSIYSSLSQGNTIKPVAHYLRMDLDYRYYLNRPKFTWATRFFGGVGIPRAGDLSLPYVKQYSTGGSFSNRGWALRTLGPGRSRIDSNLSTQVVDRTGDIKLELNTEARIRLMKLFSTFMLEGAVFTDAGNIWLFHESDVNEGGKFDLNYLWQDIAISSGIGARLDFTFFVFRVDWGFPLKHPYKLTNSGWDFQSLKLSSGHWNIAIGYPF